MRAIIQRVKHARVTVDETIIGHIDQGLLILLGMHSEDSGEDIDWLLRKIINMRIFADDEDKMNLSLIDKDYSLLVVSQFTLYASTKKGNRPSFINSAKPEIAIPLYEDFISKAKQLIGEEKVQSGAFGENMKVHLINDGPVTIFIDSKNPE